MMSNAVECGACAYFSRSEYGTGKCAARGGVGGEGARKWPYLTYENFPILCSDFEAKPAQGEPILGQRRLELGAA